jgi:type II secretory pathway pseudopilin PulG
MGKLQGYSRRGLALPAGDRGFSYVEILVAIVLIAVCLIPALKSLSPAFFGIMEREKLGSNYLAVRSKLEEVLAASYRDLEIAAQDAGGPLVPSSLSEPAYMTSDGRQIVLQVYLSGYDADNADGDNNRFTGTDEGILWVKVQVDGSPESLETFTSMYEQE